MPSFGSRLRARLSAVAGLAALLVLALGTATTTATGSTTPTTTTPTTTTPTTTSAPASTTTSPAPATTTPKAGRGGTAASGFYVAGAGDGHGVGMSQYGALGFAIHGFTDTQILAHYYAQTKLATISPNHTVTVLLHNGKASFSGANRANGRPLTPATSYTVSVKGDQLELLDGRRVVVAANPPLTVSGSGPLTFGARAQYRGALVFRPNAHGSIQTVNQLGIEDYVRGVVAGEMPSHWPPAALEAQAIAARTYALTSAPRSPDYDLYDDTRSQVYGGVRAETPSTDAAVGATTGQVVEYDGVPATTYFFASSGGHTEDVQNVWTGVSPEAWLQGVSDPYDDSGGNPFYRWKVSMSLAKAARKLHALLKGSLVGVKVLKRGVSPRVVDAEVVGTRGTTLVSGVMLEQALGLMSTYVDFTTITATGTNTTGTLSTPPPTSTSSTSSTTATQTTTSPTGGSGIAVGTALRGSGRAGASLEPATISGTSFPARRGVGVVALIRRAGRLVVVARGRTSASGRYALTVPGSGRYRVRLGSTLGPTVAIG